jgi:hypothetical protein
MVATLARFVDYDATAKTIHDTCEQIFVDENAIFAALAPLNRDPAEVDRLLTAYQAKYHEDLITRLGGELAASELQQAMFLLRRAPSAGMQAVADEAESMVGGMMTWTHRAADSVRRRRARGTQAARRRHRVHERHGPRRNGDRERRRRRAG